MGLDFAFDHVGVRRMEGLAATQNSRGDGAFRKRGAAREAPFRCPLTEARDDGYLQPVRDLDWQQAKVTWNEGPLSVH